MDFFTIYIRHEALILIPVLYFIGLLLNQTPFIPKWSYGWIKVSFAVVSCLLYFGFDIRFVIQGILVAGAEMVFRDLIHETILNFYRERKDKIRKN